MAYMIHYRVSLINKICQKSHQPYNTNRIDKPAQHQSALQRNQTKSVAFALLPAELALQDVPGAPLVDPVHEELRHHADLAAFSNFKSLAKFPFRPRSCAFCFFAFFFRVIRWLLVELLPGETTCRAEIRHFGL